MLTQISVRHLAVVEDLSLQFQSGMSSLTGETGAGKSMLVDALSLVLGDRADSNMIRQGHDRAEIEASFDISHNPALRAWLIDNELDDDLNCQLRRTISRDGRSKAYINGRAVPVSQLKAISELSIDIHGQHAHQSLLRPEVQRDLVDTVSENRSLLKQLSEAYRHWKQLQQTLDTAQQQVAQNQARVELLAYQIEELSADDLSTSRIQQLLTQQQQLTHAHDLTQCCESALHLLFEQERGAVYAQLSTVIKQFEKLENIEPKFSSILETLNSALINLDESQSDIRNYLDQNELDAGQLQEIEQLISKLQDLARKHHTEIEQLPELFTSLQTEYTELSQASQNLTDIEQSVETAYQQCVDLSAQLRHRRQQVLPELSQRITESIQQLAIPTGHVEFVLTPLADNKFSETGTDTIKILVSTNPGQPPGDLAKVASGGELARISLAIQVITAGKRSVPTLIFDEVDVGIGGGIAEIVGQHLRLLAQTQQVICITHLPQVASQAHHQLQVTKHFSKDSTAIEIHSLTREQRIQEIARMLGGMQLTEKTRSHAEEMLDQAQR